MSYSYDISYHRKSTGNRSAQTGNGATLQETKQALAQALWYLLNLNHEQGEDIEILDFNIVEVCSECGGAGRRLKARSKWTYLDCKKCKGSSGLAVQQ